MIKLIFTLLSVTTFFCSYSQHAESEIRQLENDARQAILKKDTVALRKLFSPDFLVNSPANKVETFQNLMARIRQGTIDRESFEKNIEKISIVQNIAIVMGNEVVKPAGDASHAGKMVKRRYTNIWIKDKDGWKLLARQSTITSLE